MLYLVSQEDKRLLVGGETEMREEDEKRIEDETCTSTEGYEDRE